MKASNNHDSSYPYHKMTPSQVYEMRATAEQSLDFLDQFRGQEMSKADVNALFAPWMLILNYCDQLELLNQEEILE